MKAKKEQSIVSSKLWLNQEVGELAGFAHEQLGYAGVEYAIKELQRLAKIFKKDLKK